MFQQERQAVDIGDQLVTSSRRDRAQQNDRLPLLLGSDGALAEFFEMETEIDLLGRGGLGQLLRA